jgi:uncharacterized protein YndB with AHSA1/START domain
VSLALGVTAILLSLLTLVLLSDLRRASLAVPGSLPTRIDDALNAVAVTALMVLFGFGLVVLARGLKRPRARPGTHALRFERVVDAARELVCRAWTEPDRVKAWYRPDESWSTPTAEIDLRPGGAYRFGLKPPGGPTFHEVGTFLEVSLPDRLVYTLRFEGEHRHEQTGEEIETYETVITATFDELASGQTRVIVVHDGYRTVEDRDRHRNGWPRFLDRLAAYCATAPA